MKLLFETTAKRSATALLKLLSFHSSEYEMIKHENKFLIMRTFGATVDGGGVYRGVIAEFEFVIGGGR